MIINANLKKKLMPRRRRAVIPPVGSDVITVAYDLFARRVPCFCQ